MTSQITSLSLKLVAFIQYFTTATRKKTKVETGTEKEGSCCDKHDHVAFGRIELFCGKNVEVFGTLV